MVPMLIIPRILRIPNTKIWCCSCHCHWCSTPTIKEKCLWMTTDMNVMNVTICETYKTGMRIYSSLDSFLEPAGKPPVRSSLQSCPPLPNYTSYSLSPSVLHTHILTTCGALCHHLLTSQMLPSSMATCPQLSLPLFQSDEICSSIPCSTALLLSVIHYSGDPGSPDWKELEGSVNESMGENDDSGCHHNKTMNNYTNWELSFNTNSDMVMHHNQHN